MTRSEFIQAYATRSGLTSKWHDIGLFDPLDRADRKIALPCACGDEGCEGWAMVGIEQVLHHLFFCAPDGLRTAYQEAVGNQP